MSKGEKMSERKEKADFKSLFKLARYCKKYLPAIIVSMVCAILGTIAIIIGPEKISELTNLIVGGIVTGIDIEAVTNVGLTLAGIYLGGALLSYAQQFIVASVTQYVSKKLRTDVDQKINRMPLSFLDKTTKGDMLSRMTNDIDMLNETLSMSVASLVSAIALFIGVVWKMFTTNTVLALVTVGASLLGFIFMALVLSKSQKYFERKQKDLGVMNGQTEEIFTNHKIMRAFGGKRMEAMKFIKTNNRLYDSNWKSQFLSGMMMPVMMFVGNLSYALIFIVGVLFIVNGNTAVTLGTIMAFVLYARLFSQPLSTFAQAMTSIQQASAAARRVFEILEAEEMSNEKEKTVEIKKVNGDVVFDHVYFGYETGKPIIRDFSAKLEQGQKVAIVGPTGAGKTTMVNLLMRFYDVWSGKIMIDGIAIQDMKREKVHDLFDMILQDTWLFDGTIRENLVYNKHNVPEGKLDEACRAVGLKHFIETLPEGYDTVLDDALSLSEGQKQQLTIARAMIKDSPLLILDEATSSIDTRTEMVIQRAMDKLAEGRTAFVIAHRLSTIRNADVILVMRDGDIVEQGNHKSLMKKNGFYAELYNSQFASFE